MPTEVLSYALSLLVPSLKQSFRTFTFSNNKIKRRRTNARMEIIQVPPTDRQKPSDNIRSRTFFILNNRLDEDVLRSALDRLIRYHWRKLGARLITRPKDGLPEYHLPRIFDEKYALFNWSSQEYDHSIDKVEFFPKPTPPENGIALLPPPRFIEHWFRPLDWPLDRKEEPAGALCSTSICLFLLMLPSSVSTVHIYS